MTFAWSNPEVFSAKSSVSRNCAASRFEASAIASPPCLQEKQKNNPLARVMTSARSFLSLQIGHGERYCVPNAVSALSRRSLLKPPVFPSDHERRNNPTWFQ